MSYARMARAKQLAFKSIDYSLQLARQPRLAVIAARGVHLASYLSLQAEWFRSADIATVVDVGANSGQFASAIHELLPEANIYSFEPLPDSFSALQRRISAMGRGAAFNVAIGDESSRIAFYQNAFAKSSSALRMADAHKEAFPWTANATRIEVDVRPLDSFLPQLELKSKVLVKIDVQGFEDRVLRGGAQVMRNADYAFVETSFVPVYEGQPSFESVYEIMSNYGFRFGGMMDQLEDPRDGRILQADAIFMRASSDS